MALDPKTLRKLVLAVIALGLLILLLVGIIRYNNPLMFITIFFWMTGVVSENTGMNVWLARMIAIPFAAVITVGVIRGFSWNKQKQIEGLVIISLVMLFWNGGMFYFTKDFAFNPTTGKPAQCFAVTPTGFEYVPCVWKVHAIYGTPVQPLTRDIVNADWNRKNGAPKMQTIEASRDLRFFSPDGSPLIWYYKHDDGRLEFFGQPGVHPQMNKPLSPVTPEIVNLMFKYLEERNRTMVAVDESRPTRVQLEHNPTSGRELEKLRNMLAHLR